MEVAIQDNAASPGFFPGPLQPGGWTVLVDTHMIMPGVPIHLELAFEWMSRGLRMALTAGTDRHNPHDPAPGHAFNLVYAEELSEAAILRAVRLGHLVLSSGPPLTLSAQVSGQKLMPGDSCRAQARETIHISAEWGACPPGSHLDLVVDGAKRAMTAGGPSASWDLPGGQTG